MAGKKYSPIWKMSKERFKSVVESSRTISEVLDHFGFQNKGGHYKTFHARVKRDKIDISHFDAAEARAKKLRTLSAESAIPWEAILIENSPYRIKGHRKIKLVDEGLLANRCQICDLKPAWQDKELVLILDHINGINTDNRIENLRLVCPNCNSQLETHCGKNKAAPPNRCAFCQKEISKTAAHCKACVPRKTKIVWPPTEDLLIKVETLGLSETARQLGLSLTSVKKKIKKSFPKWKSSYFKNKKPQ